MLNTILAPLPRFQPSRRPWIRWVIVIELLTIALVSYAYAQDPVSSQTKSIATVIADGLGGTIDSAVQNAAQNALTQVVGSFVNTETQVAKHSEITDGIRRQTRNISNKNREYSQGSIKSFEVLDSRQDGAIFHVTAKVAVQVEVLHEELKQALAGTTSVSKGLFAQAATEQSQQTNADSIFIDHIVMPLTSGAGLTLQVGTPSKFDIDAAHLPCRTMSIPNAWLPPRGEALKPMCPPPVEGFIQNRSINDVYAIPVALTADSGTATMLWRTATSISRAPCLRLDLHDKAPFAPLSQVMMRQAEQANDPAYRSKYRYVAVAQRIGESSFGEGCYQILANSAGYDAAMSRFAQFVFQVTVLDQQGTPVEQYLFHPYTQPRNGGENEAVSLDFRPAFHRIGMEGGTVPQFDVFVPPKNQSFHLLVHVPIEVLRRAERMEIKVVSE